MDNTEGPDALRGRRGRRWSLDAAMPLFISHTKSPEKPKRNRSCSVVGPESIFVPPSIIDKHGGIQHKVQKNWRKFKDRRNSFSAGHKDFVIVATLNDGSTKMLTSMSGQTIRDALNTAHKMELKISSYRVITSSSRSALPSFTNSMSMSESLEDLLQDVLDKKSNPNLLATDGRYATLHNLFESECIYQQNLRSIFDTYAEPLRKFSSLSKEDHKILFSGVEPILSLSKMLSSKVEVALRQWDPGTACLGSLFSKNFWHQYEEYMCSFPMAAEHLLAKKKIDDSFVEFCELRQGSSDQSIEDLLALPVKRLPRYEEHLKDLLEETAQTHPDFEELTRALDRVKEMVVEHAVIGDVGGTEIEAIQDKFPYDDLQLHYKDKPSTQPLQRRRRSAPSALLLKTLGSSRSRSAGSLISSTSNSSKKEDFIQSSRIFSGRYFVKEGPVQIISQGYHLQERYLFLFNDVLLVAKLKSANTYKLKQRVRVCNLWTSLNVDELMDVSRIPQHSFILGWPLTNHLVSCSSDLEKHDWLHSLESQIEEERKKLSLASITINIRASDDFDPMKEISVNIHQSAKDILRQYAEKCHLSDSETKELEVCVMSGSEDTPYPLIGHEIPYSICSTEGENPQSAPLQPRFLIRNRKITKQQALEDGRKQKGKTFLSLFKRSSRDSMDSGNPAKLFGQSLDSVMEDEELPKSIMTLLRVLCRHGPQTHGILRKSPNDRIKKELKQRLDDGENCITDDTAPHIVGALVKDYLRSLPDSLLGDDLYEKWMAAEAIEDTTKKMNVIKQLSCQLPSSNFILLKHVMCILYHIDSHSEWSKMDASNLAICMAQSMLRFKGTPQPAQVKMANSLLQFMIEHCVKIFGEDTPLLLSVAEHKEDSGSDTDSITETNDNLPRDDSSLDSLEKDDPTEVDSIYTKAKSHLSAVNLSNDSGVTLSDNQLLSDENQYTRHTSASKRCSADSLCSVDELSEMEEKSESIHHSQNTHEVVSDSEIQTTRPRERLVRQSSVMSSTPPMSPQPKLSYSSDSLLSDSSASYLQEYGDSACPASYFNGKYSQSSVNHNKLLHNLEKSHSDEAVPNSKHSVVQRRYSDESIHYDSQSMHGRAQLRHAYQAKVPSKHLDYLYASNNNNVLFSKEFDDSSSQPLKLSVPETERLPINCAPSKESEKHAFCTTRPSRIVLQSYCQSHQSPDKAMAQNYPTISQTTIIGDQPRRPILESRTVSVIRKQHNVIKIKSKSSSLKSDKAQLVSQVIVKPRPVHPPSYQEALNRKDKLSRGLPVDVSLQDTISQKKASAHAKQLYEQSLKQFIKDTPNANIKTSFSSSSSSEEEFLPGKDPKKVYEESIRQFKEQQFTTSAQCSKVSSANNVRSQNPGTITVGHSKNRCEPETAEDRTNITVGHFKNRCEPETAEDRTNITVAHSKNRCEPEMTVHRTNVTVGYPNNRCDSEHRTVIQIPSVRDSKLVEIRNKDLSSVSRSTHSSPHNPSNMYFYNPKQQTEGINRSRVKLSHQPHSTDSRFHPSSNHFSGQASGLSWSVADLRKNYLSSSGEPLRGQSHQKLNIVTVSSSSSQRPPPPPYHPPPPFRPNPDSNRQAVASNHGNSEDSSPYIKNSSFHL